MTPMDNKPSEYLNSLPRTHFINRQEVSLDKSVPKLLSAMLEIGPYTITKYGGLEGGFWIGKKCGEGMQASEAKLCQWLHHFYQENF